MENIMILKKNGTWEIMDRLDKKLGDCDLGDN